jgi:hypothetical protein
MVKVPDCCPPSFLLPPAKASVHHTQPREWYEENIDTLVAPLLREDKKKAAHVRKSRFIYDRESNEYTCPNNKRLAYQATYKRRKGGKDDGQFDRYNIKYTVCINCPYFKECVTPSQQKNSQGRTIDRCVYEPSR